MAFWHDKTFVVTGGTGFLGSYVTAALLKCGASRVHAIGSADYDLRDLGQCRKMLADRQPEIIIHLAAVVGGIGANRDRPAEFFYDNLMMGVQLFHEAWRAGVAKFVTVGTVCSYPRNTPVPFDIKDLWNGYPEDTNAPYGLAKKMLLVQGQAYRDQYGFNSIYLLPTNLYGPGDNFDPASSHVIPSLVRKFVEAKRDNLKKVVAWGTGSPTRDFLFVEDAAKAIVLATERYDGAEPVNIGSGVEISIRELTELIAELVGFEGEITWDVSKPDGQPRRALNVVPAEEKFGFRAYTDFRTGLQRTIEHYQSSPGTSRG